LFCIFKLFVCALLSWLSFVKDSSFTIKISDGIKISSEMRVTSSAFFSIFCA